LYSHSVAFFEFRTRRGAAETRAASADALRLYQAHQREVRAASRLQAIYRGVLGRVDADKTRRIVEQYRAFVEECARHLQVRNHHQIIFFVSLV
jgi:hypothetical protein